MEPKFKYAFLLQITNLLESGVVTWVSEQKITED